LERDRHKKPVVGPITKGVPPSLINFNFLCVFISLNETNGKCYK